MPGAPFGFDEPPAEPPPGCRDGERWRWAHALYVQHGPGGGGVCAVCQVVRPCFLYRLALRALVDTCAGEARHRPMPGPPRIVARSSCRWCGQEIGLHSRWGWLHLDAGLLLCREAEPSAPPLCVAEPAD